ncbi:MAG: helix-turn-helix domain-containing protein [bacterium]|nr:helix-turn-helix domain-containing protein [bacterium]
MRNKLHIVTLTPEERRLLKKISRTAKADPRKRLRARILLKADTSPEGKAWLDRWIAEDLGVSTAHVWKLRKSLAENGLETTLNRKVGRPHRKVYNIILTASERTRLHALIESKGEPADKKCRAQLLLRADIGPKGDAWSDQQITATYNVSNTTLWRLRRLFARQGLEAALGSPPPQQQSLKFFANVEPVIIHLASSKPPPGRTHWTLRLLANHLVATGRIAAISHETVRQILKKHHCESSIGRSRVSRNRMPN